MRGLGESLQASGMLRDSRASGMLGDSQASNVLRDAGVLGGAQLLRESQDLDRSPSLRERDASPGSGSAEDAGVFEDALRGAAVEFLTSLREQFAEAERRAEEAVRAELAER